MDLITREYRTIKGVAGPLVMVEGLSKAAYGEMCYVRIDDGDLRAGQILKIEGNLSVVQVLEGSSGIDSHKTSVIPTGDVARAPLSEDILGRVFDGSGSPIDGYPPVVPEKKLNINGSPINPVSREKPSSFIETGISVIDGLNTLVRGQKLPIFSSAGLPANDLVLQILRQARVAGEGADDFCVVFGAMGITSREAFFFREGIEEAGAMERTVSYINLASDPTVERLFTPRLALTAAEYLAFEKGYHVMVVITDMTAYCDALREIGSAREEIPGRRSYPGYMYTDLSTLYERAGCIKGCKGSVTVMPILTMPEDDITHPIPDLTGYITEGQIVLGRAMHLSGIYPPIDALPCLSRLMNLGIGEGKTRKDHRALADQLYSSYARGVDVRRLASIVGEEGLTETDRAFLKFSGEFEGRYIGQGETRRTIGDTMELAEELLGLLPESELRKRSL